MRAAREPLGRPAPCSRTNRDAGVHRHGVHLRAQVLSRHLSLPGAPAGRAGEPLLRRQPGGVLPPALAAAGRGLGVTRAPATQGSDPAEASGFCLLVCAMLPVAEQVPPRPRRAVPPSERAGLKRASGPRRQDVVDSLCRDAASGYNASCVPVEELGAAVCLFPAQ